MQKKKKICSDLFREKYNFSKSFVEKQRFMVRNWGEVNSKIIRNSILREDFRTKSTALIGPRC